MHVFRKTSMRKRTQLAVKFILSVRLRQTSGDPVPIVIPLDIASPCVSNALAHVGVVEQAPDLAREGLGAVSDQEVFAGDDVQR